jgi:hypothetical protein
MALSQRASSSMVMLWNRPATGSPGVLGGALAQLAAGRGPLGGALRLDQPGTVGQRQQPVPQLPIGEPGRILGQRADLSQRPA